MWIENPYPEILRQNGIRLRQIGEKVLDGVMMPMAASDGPHYGNNIALKDGLYDTIVFCPSMKMETNSG